MTGHLRQIRKFVADFFADQDAVAMTEVIIAVPFLTILAVGVLEFGGLFWQREQIETGLRDAARYMARCRHPVAICEAAARNLAYFGIADVPDPPPPLRVPYWDATNSPITFTPATVGAIMTATTTHDLVLSPLFGYLLLPEITMSAHHNQRVIGW